MKTIKGNWLGIFIFFSILFGSCFSPPEFSIVPTIKNPVLEFKRGVFTDSLILYLDFEDGDGDLGLGTDMTDFPYHPVNFYLENNGDTIALSTSRRFPDMPAFINVPAGAQGKLVTSRTRENPIYDDMFPFYICPFTVTSYLKDSIFVSEEDAHIFDNNTHHVVEHRTEWNAYKLLDTFYIQPNPNHYNIDVEFYIQNNPNSGGPPFTLFDWKNELCTAPDFTQRFPILTDSENPLAGTLKYGMTSTGFTPLFGGRSIKLRVRIRDRGLHVSKFIDTNVITIQ